MAYRILVIDDETAIREAMRMTLEYEGYKVEEARSGEDGLDKAGKTPYDAMLLDIKMPVIDGMETLDNLKRAEDRHAGGHGLGPRRHLHGGGVHQARRLRLPREAAAAGTSCC